MHVVSCRDFGIEILDNVKKNIGNSLKCTKKHAYYFTSIKLYIYIILL